MAASNEIQGLFDEVTLGELTDQAAAAHQAAGGNEVTEDEKTAAQERARALIDESRDSAGAAGPMAGMGAMRALTLSIGMPVPRILLDAMVEVSTANAGRKKTWRKQLKKMSEVKEQGCIKVEFYDIVDKKSNTVYLVLDRCGADHDLTAELDKIYSRIPGDKKPEILQHLSALVYLGRSAYGQMAAKMLGLLKDIGKKMGGSASEFDPMVLGVDPVNTTFYVPHVDGFRVGIFVRLEDEFDRGAGMSIPDVQKESSDK